MRRALLAGVAIAVVMSAPAWAQTATTGNVIEELVVTAQKREESVQDVPIAVSAFGESALRARKIDGAQNLVESVPNLSFTRTTTRTNFQIRGIGNQLGGATGDDGVGVHHNNAPLTQNRAADAEFFDVERVEVLRGPQGTLFGRNATGGIVNVITNKPQDSFSASATVDLGNYDSKRLNGYINLPLGDRLALRAAGFALQRDGYLTNLLNGQDVDDRKIFSGRVTLSFAPTDNLSGYLLWEGFDEDDSRIQAKQLCYKDPGLASIGGVPTGAAQVAFTGGCLPLSVYDERSYGTTNQLSTFSGIFGRQAGIQSTDAFGGKFISRDLREVELVGRPQYHPRANLFELNLEWLATPSLIVTSLTSYNEDRADRRADSTGGYASVPFPISAVAPNGLLNDPQLGLTDRLQTEEAGRTSSEQWTQELRLQSSFDGPLNFNVGAIYVDFQSNTIGYVASSTATAIVKLVRPSSYVDPLRDPDFTGHNYYTSHTDYKLKSKAAFGELYWQALDDVRVTLGLRYTSDEKWTIGGSTLFLPGRGPVYTTPQSVTFNEATGRLNVDWSPDLSFTDDTLIYASYSKGYKGGGFNHPGVVLLGLKSAYDPEFVNAIEIGAKNTLLDGSLVLNLTGFHYTYKGYQIARSVNRASYNENIDATIYGAEMETIWQPIHGLRFNANIGYLKTKIDQGLVVDTFYRTMNDPNYVLANSVSGGCILTTAGAAAILATRGGVAALTNSACAGSAGLANALVAQGVPAAQASSLTAGAYAFGANVSRYSNGSGDGVIQSLKDNELPNAPRWTASFGAQYEFTVGDWDATLRGDYYWQAKSFARYNNQWFDEIKAWQNMNATLTFENADLDLSVQFYARNLANEDTIVGYVIADENLGATRRVQVLDPRLYGVAFTKRF